MNTGLIGERLQLDTGGWFRWSDPDRLALALHPGDAVTVLTDEGALRRGRRRWYPGAQGVVLRKSKYHDLAWIVAVHGHEALLFSDEMQAASAPALASHQ